MKAPTTIKRAIRNLRKRIDDPATPADERRVAYTLEQAMRWATEKTTGWESPDKSLPEDMKLLRMGL